MEEVDSGVSRAQHSGPRSHLRLQFNPVWGGSDCSCWWPARVRWTPMAPTGHRLIEPKPRRSMWGPARDDGMLLTMEINEWWAGNADQRYWMEITDRPDLG